MKIIVLGGGLVGGPMALDLAAEDRFQVTVADRDENVVNALAAKAPITPLVKDLSDPAAITALVKNYDLVVGAVPGFMGFQTLRAVIEAERNVVDLAFFPEDPFELDELAKEKGVTSMARTTGYTATMTVRLIADGLYSQKGISPPEYLGREPGCTSYLLDGLAARGINYVESRNEDVQ